MEGCGRKELVRLVQCSLSEQEHHLRHTIATQSLIVKLVKKGSFPLIWEENLNEEEIFK